MAETRKLSVFLENILVQHSREAAFVYENPIDIICVTDPDDIEDGLLRIRQATEDGSHVAGWISYETGLVLEQRLRPLLSKNPKVPFIYMGIFDDRKVLDTIAADYYWQHEQEKMGYNLSNLSLSQTRTEYSEIFEKIHEYLKAGDIYQVNYTQKARFDFEGSAKALYAALRNAQAVEYAAFIETDDISVLSLSPELFIKKDGANITAKPMKGTGRRGRFEQEDIKYSEALYNSKKDRAENLMIVDLLRNDLSRLARNGSVEVSKLYEIEKYRTLFTMTSTIKAQVEKETSPVDIIRSIFPCGSVTGAPKIRAQEIINEIENEQRSIYTGAIGYFSPNGDMCLSVPIRTLTIDKKDRGELGIGGAIVADSEVEKEYKECLLKADFLSRSYPKFDLIESIGWTQKDGYGYLEDHLDRLKRSANYYSFPYNRSELVEKLNEHAKFLPANKGDRYKVRLLLSRRGSISIISEKIPMVFNDILPKITLAEHPINSEDPIYFHKTTCRNYYENELRKKQKETGCFDVIFHNEKGEITEGSFTNIFIKKGNIYYTPKQECGLLGGVFRQKVLEDDKIKTDETIIYKHDLEGAEQIFLCNSIRGMIEVKLDK